MKKIIVLLLLVVSIYGKVSESKAEVLADEWSRMTPNQHATIFRAYLDGKPYDLGMTLAAIAWEESQGGKYQISTDGKDFGIYHINIYWYLKEIKVKDNLYTRAQYATILMTQPDHCLEYVLLKLQILRHTYGKDYMTIWERYNGKAVYAKRIQAKVKFLNTKLVNLNK